MFSIYVDRFIIKFELYLLKENFKFCEEIHKSAKS